MAHQHTPLLLIVLDGWGYREDPKYNAIANASTPHWDSWWQKYPHTLIDASGESVGLPPGQMGNSEVGHMHIGAGRELPQDYTRINEAIVKGQLTSNSVLQDAINYAKQHQVAIHILGLISPGGVHSHEQQIFAVCQEIAKHQLKPIIHAFLDGRDTPPRSAKASLEIFENSFPIASIIGRYYAMDRDQRWQRTQAAYDLITGGPTLFEADDAMTALSQAYERGENDEFVNATRIEQNQIIRDGDVVIFMNFRADRARQLSHALIDQDFSHFKRNKVFHDLYFVTLTNYAGGIKSHVMFPPYQCENTLGEYLSQLNYRQLRIAETEKYPHVTYFLNGGREQSFPLEERILIPSPKIATYDLQPEMSAPEITDQIISFIKDKKTDVIIANFANPDMVGHSGNYEATIKAIECIDHCLGRIEKTLRDYGGEMIITADHGNAEKMYDSATHQPHTSHTSDRVPFIYLGRHATIAHENGSLIDIAPTLLYVLGLQKPQQMTGQRLIKFV